MNRKEFIINYNIDEDVWLYGEKKKPNLYVKLDEFDDVVLKLNRKEYSIDKNKLERLVKSISKKVR